MNEADSSGRFSRRAGVAATFFLVAGVVAAAGGLGLAPVAALAGLAVFPLRRLMPALTRGGAALHFGAAFLIYAALATLWSPYRGATDEIGAQMARTILGWPLYAALAWAAASADPADRQLIRRSGIAAVVGLAAILLFELASDGHLFRIIRGAGEDPGMIERNHAIGAACLIALAWGAIAALSRGGRQAQGLGVLLIGVTGFLSLQFGLTTNATAFAAALTAFLIASVAPRFAVLLTAATAALGLLAAPLLGPLIQLADPAWLETLPTSWKQRLAMMDFVAQRVAERPLAGWGLDASRTFQAPMTVDGLTTTAVMLHPHNIGLQIWLELGAIGAGLASLSMLALGVQVARARRDDRVGGAAAAASLAAFFCLGFFSFGLWQEWYGALGFAAAGLAAAAGRLRSPNAAG